MKNLYTTFYISTYNNRLILHKIIVDSFMYVFPISMQQYHTIIFVSEEYTRFLWDEYFFWW